MTPTQTEQKRTPLSNRISIEEYGLSPELSKWAVYVDERAPELFDTQEQAGLFARGVDIGHASDDAIVRVLREMVAWEPGFMPASANPYIVARALLAKLEKEIT